METGVELEEEVLARGGIEEVLNGTGANVADGLSKALRSELHLLEDLRRNDRRRAFLEDLLEPALGRAITPIKGSSVAVLIPHDLDLDVAGLGAELHHEHGAVVGGWVGWVVDKRGS